MGAYQKTEALAVEYLTRCSLIAWVTETGIRALMTASISWGSHRNQALSILSAPIHSPLMHKLHQAAAAGSIRFVDIRGHATNDRHRKNKTFERAWS
jgi:hypothetical protein